MKRKAIIICCVVSLALNCTEDQQGKPQPEIGQPLQDASREFGQSVVPPEQSESTGAHVTPVDFHDLQALLPEAVLNLTRETSSGETSGAFGFTLSTAEGQDADEEGRSITIKLTDLGSWQSLSSMSAFSWAVNEIDLKTSTGYEKTIRHQGRRGYEKSDNESCELSVLVADRFVVEVNGYQIELADLRAALALIDLGKLERMKSHGLP
jgi:hypothetical protein